MERLSLEPKAGELVNWMQPAFVISGFAQLYHVSFASSALPVLSSSKWPSSSHVLFSGRL